MPRVFNYKMYVLFIKYFYLFIYNIYLLFYLLFILFYIFYLLCIFYLLIFSFYFSKELERLTQVATAAFKSGTDSVDLLRKQVNSQRKELEEVKHNHK